ncbi:MAG: hypothetical protein HY816_15575 [Candidatus Wallbacteria bacterium]|nr:hypothetical protein [Candidatus Wallbacteria bacterium]
MIIPWLAILPFALLFLAAVVLLAFKKFYVTVGPDEFVVHYRSGKVKHIGRGLSFFCLPYDTFLKVPGTLRDINFVADQITKEKQGVRVQGFLAYRIADFERAYQNLDLRSGVIRTLPKIEDNIKNKDYETKNRESVVRLDPNDPLAKTDEILRRLAESVVRHEVSNKTLNEMITEREAVVQSMREQVMNTVQEWGLSVDTIEFAEVWIRSRELFEHLQADYRNQVRLSAQNSTAETNKEIAAKQMESDKAVAMMTAGAEREKRIIATQEEQRASEAELGTRRTIKQKEAEVAQHLQLLEKENKHQAQLAELSNLQLVKQREAEAKQALELLDKENRHKAQLREQALAHERELQVAQNAIEKQSRQHDVLVDKLTKEEALRLQEAKTAEALAMMAEKARIEQAELDRQREAVKLQALLDEKENESRQQEIALAAEIKRMKELADAQLEKARLEAQAILEVGKAEAEVLRMKVEAQNTVSAAQLQEQLIAKLPEIAHAMKIQDIHWVNMAGNGDSPMSLVPKNIMELLTVFRGFGVDLQGLLKRGGESSE